MKLLRSPFLVILQTFFTQRVLKGKLGSPRALQWHLDILKHLRYSGTRRAFGHVGTRAVERHSDTLALGDSRHSRHFI